MSGSQALDLATFIALGLLSLALFVALIRLVRGPTLPDRILALDVLTTLGLGFIAVMALRTGLMLYLDIAISLGLVGFLATVAFARYVMQQGRAGQQQDTNSGPGEEAQK